MSKPIIITVPCGTNVVTAKTWLEQDGAGAMKVMDASGVPKGVSLAAKDAQNNVGMVVDGLMKLPAAAAVYNVGDVLEAHTSGVVAYSAGTKVAMAAETKTITADYTSTDELMVYVNPDKA